MRWPVFSALPLIALGACAHVGPAIAKFDCIDTFETPERTIGTTRTLDSKGRQLSVESSWREHLHKPDLHVGAARFGSSGDPNLRSNHIVLSFSEPAPYDREDFGGVELRVGTPFSVQDDKAFVNRKRINAGVYPPWPAMQALLQSGSPIYLVMLDRKGAPSRAEQLNRSMFTRALQEVRKSLDRSRGSAANFRANCIPHEEIIVT